MSYFVYTDGDGIGNVPETYAHPEGRKVVEDSKKISALVKDPNKFFFAIIGIVLVLILILVLLISGIVRLIRRVRRNRK